MSPYIEPNTLISGQNPATGLLLDILGSETNTLYYNYTGSSPSSSAVLGIEASDVAGNWGYIIDTQTFTGLGSQTQLSTFSNPINNGIRGFISSSNLSNSQIFIDSLYNFGDELILLYSDNEIMPGQPKPLVSKVDNQIRFGERWNTTSTITLNGQVTGFSYESILSAQQELLNVFNKDFENFSIIQGGQTLYSQDFNIIKDINFGNSLYRGVLDYTVTLESQPQYLFSGMYGVTNPGNEWSFAETDDKLLEITHTISAKGINTSSSYSNSFDNAKNYVLGLTGTNSFIPPFFSLYCTGASMCIDSFKENINRFENSYSVVEKYVPLDMFHGGAGYIRESFDYNCNLSNGIASLSVKGEVKSCKNVDLNTLRQKYINYDVFGAAVAAYFEACGRTDLNPNYLVSGVNEDPYSKIISFDIQFDNDFTPKTYFDYSSEVKIGEDDITIVGINGTIKGRGDLLNKYSLVENYFNTQLNLFALANESYKESDISHTYPLRNQQLNYSVSKNPFLGEITVSTSYDNKDLIPPGFQYLNYTLAFKPALRQLSSIPLPICPSADDYYTVDLGYANRMQFSVNGQATVCAGTSESSIADINNIANDNLIKFGKGSALVEKKSITQSNAGNGKTFKFNFGYSYDSTSVTVTPFSSINAL